MLCHQAQRLWGEVYAWLASQEQQYFDGPGAVFFALRGAKHLDGVEKGHKRIFELGKHIRAPCCFRCPHLLRVPSPPHCKLQRSHVGDLRIWHVPPAVDVLPGSKPVFYEVVCELAAYPNKLKQGLFTWVVRHGARVNL